MIRAIVFDLGGVLIDLDFDNCVRSFRERDVFGYDFIYRDIWHTEDDLYDKLIPAYMEHSAVVQAVAAYGLANLDHLLSREGLFK